MTTHNPLVLTNGAYQQLQSGDSVVGNLLVSKYTIVGTILSGTGTPRWYPDRDVTLLGVYFSLGTTGSVLDVTIDVLKNGTSILSGTYPTCYTGTHKSTSVALSTTITTSDYLTIDVTAADGADMLVCIQYK